MVTASSASSLRVVSLSARLLCLSQAIIQLLWPSVVELAQSFGEASPTAQEQALVIDSAEILRREVDASTVNESDASTVFNHICMMR